MAETCTSVMLRLIDRIELLEHQMASLDADIKALYARASAEGYDNRTLRRMIKLRRIEPGSKETDDSLKALYREAVDIGVHESWF